MESHMSVVYLPAKDSYKNALNGNWTETNRNYKSITDTLTTKPEGQALKYYNLY